MAPCRHLGHGAFEHLQLQLYPAGVGEVHRDHYPPDQYRV
jgi:hypothetical protein